jgi:hypothetical protein
MHRLLPAIVIIITTTGCYRAMSRDDAVKNIHRASEVELDDGHRVDGDRFEYVGPDQLAIPRGSRIKMTSSSSPRRGRLLCQL